MKYEYQVFTLRLESFEKKNDADLTDTLNQYGACGWELVTVDHSPNSSYYKVFLKRVIMDGKSL